MRTLLAVLAAISIAGGAFAQKPTKVSPKVSLKSPKWTKKLVEPTCCKSKKCHHSTGEDKHHVCNKMCHDSHQAKGTCCNAHQHTKAKSTKKNM